MRNVFAKIIDSISVLSVSFVLIFAWIRFYTHDITLSLIVGSICSAIICFIVNYFFYKREHQKIGSAKNKKNAENLGIALLGATNDEILEYFFNVFNKDGNKLQKRQNYLELEYYSAQNDMHSTLHSTIVYPFFHKTELGLDDLILIIKLIRSVNKTEIKIFDISTNNEAKEFASKIKNLNIQFFDQYDLYSMSNSTTAPITIDTQIAKLNYRDYLKFAFDKSRSKNYLLFGLILLISSFFVPYKIYYLIIGSLLCFTSLCVRIVPLIRKQKIPKK